MFFELILGNDVFEMEGHVLFNSFRFQSDAYYDKNVFAAIWKLQCLLGVELSTERVHYFEVFALQLCGKWQRANNLVKRAIEIEDNKNTF